MTAQERPVNGPGDGARSRQVEGAESEPNPSLKGIPVTHAPECNPLCEPGYHYLTGAVTAHLHPRALRDECQACSGGVTW